MYRRAARVSRETRSPPWEVRRESTGQATGVAAWAAARPVVGTSRLPDRAGGYSCIMLPALTLWMAASDAVTARIPPGSPVTVMSAVAGRVEAFVRSIVQDPS